MVSLLPGIALEALASLTEKLGRHAQVHLRVSWTDVAQIDRQLVQESLHVGTLLIPGGETMNGESMPQVVNSRLLACSTGTTDTCTIARGPEVLFEHPYVDGAAFQGCEKGSLNWPPSRLRAIVLDQGPPQLRSHGNQPRLPELRVPNHQNRPVQVHVGASQVYCFTQTQANPIVNQNHRADRRWLQDDAPWMGFDHLKKTTKFLPRVDVGNE
jgi:hypothetical protein